MINFWVSNILQAAGVITIAVGAGLIYPPLGVILGGIGLLLYGVAFERGLNGSK